MKHTNITGHFLIAMPALSDPCFAKALIYICEHNEQGAIGIIVNQPVDMTLPMLFEQIGITLKNPQLASSQLYFGGPVQSDRGFVLHQPVGEWHSTLVTKDEIGLTTSKDILESVGRGGEPSRFIIALGYAGWSPGQLEEELLQNAWLNVPAEADIIFNLPWNARFSAAMATLGVDMMYLSDVAGHA